MTSHDIKMIRMVLNLMSSLCKTEDLCHVILEKHNLGTLLELMGRETDIYKPIRHVIS